MINLVNQLLFLEVKMLLMNLLKQFLKSICIGKKVIKRHFNKNLFMSEEEEQFQSSNICWNCEKVIVMMMKKIRDQYHITQTIRAATHWSCKIIVIFK